MKTSTSIKSMWVLGLAICLCAFSTQQTKGQCYLDPHPYAIQDVNSVCWALGVQYVPIYICYNVENAAATNNGWQQVILYNPFFMEDIYLNVGRAGCISIIAHELGHHINMDMSPYDFDHSWTDELEADFVSGFVMRRLGYSLWDAIGAMQYMDPEISDTHPDGQRRVQAIQCGWLNG